MSQFKLLLTISVGLCLFSPSTSQTADFCNAALCPAGKTNIACNNSGSFSAACTASAKIVPITADLQKAIVNKHNALRNQIARGGFNGYQPAVRMAAMRWNKQLAQMAEYNVKQCVMKHDSCRNTPAFRYSGQNLAFAGWSGKTRTVKAVAVQDIQLWFNEYKACSMAIINSYQAATGAAYGHFTALVQEKAKAVGCAILRQTKNGSTQQYIACNYAYTNIVGKAVYRRGPAASQCTTGAHPQYKALCSLNEVYAVNDPKTF